ncbi:MAG: type IV pilus modification protein PilV [Betaproteobacteria bacterium]|nr:type IV pilus modification protein PilV [Betaproteobacteria bacterium]
MVERTNRRRRSAGFSLLEVLVTLVIVVIGLLGLLGVQVRSHQAELESYQRTQALILLADFVDRINTNRKAARCYAITDAAAGTPYVGYANSAPAACTAWSTAELQARAVADLNAWDALLKGAAETDAGTAVGAMIGARGCVSYDDVTGLYRLSVAWQGLLSTTEPLSVDSALTCGRDRYGSESQRRIVSMTLRIADLK